MQVGGVYDITVVTQRPRLGQKGPGKSAEQLCQGSHLPSCLCAGSRVDRWKLLGGKQPVLPNCLPAKPWDLLQGHQLVLQGHQPTTT